MVPLRLFTEILGYAVRWDEATCTVYISSPETRTLSGLWGFYALGSVTYSAGQTCLGPSTLTATMIARLTRWKACSWDGLRWTKAELTSGPNPRIPKPDGWPLVILQARLHGIAVLHVLCGSGSQLASLLDDEAARLRLALDIAATAATEYDGVLIDFEGLGLDQATAELDRANFNDFLTKLKSYLDNKSLAVAVPPPTGPFKGYDHGYIGEIADLVVLMAYNFQDPNWPSPVAPFKQVDNAIRQECQLVNPDKIILGIPAYGVLYRVSDEGRASMVALPPSKDGAAGFPDYPDVSATDTAFHEGDICPVFVPEYLCNYVEWIGGGHSYTAYFEDTLSLEVRAMMAQRYGLRGVAIWRLGLLPDNWWAGL